MLEVEDFISKPEPGGNPIFYSPRPKIPRLLMEKESADEAEKLLKESVNLVGVWREKESQRQTEEYE